MSAIKPRQQSIGRTRSSPLLSAPSTAGYRCSRADHDRESWGVAIEMRTMSRIRSDGLRQTASLRECSRILGPRIVGIQSIGLKIAGILLMAVMRAFAQAGGSPWENAVNALKTSFTGPIATGLSLVAIVVGGLMFAFGEGQSKKVFAGIVFGIGMAVGAVNFMAWLFP